MIKGTVTGQHLSIFQRPIVAETIDYITAQFVFMNADWQDCNKWAIFSKGEERFEIELENDAITADKHLNLAAGEWKVYLFGTKGNMRITTDIQLVTVSATGILAGKPLPDVPLSAAEQIAQNAADAKQIAQAVRSDADAGEFDGATFTPQVIDGVLSWSNDKGKQNPPDSNIGYNHSEEFTKLSEQVRADAVQSGQSAESAKQSADNAKVSETNAKVSETNAETSETQSSKNLADLLAMIGTSIPSLVDGLIPLKYIPATATVEVYKVQSESELVSLVAQRGDIAELVEDVNGEKTITKTWQLLGSDASVRDNWVVWGTSYAVQSGSATIAETANNAERINNMRLVTMNYSDFQNAVKDAETLYAVDMEA